MATHKKKNSLINEKQALTSFFESLLTDTESTPVVEIKTTSDKLSTEFEQVSEVKETVFLPDIPHVVEPQAIEETISEVVKVEISVDEYSQNDTISNNVMVEHQPTVPDQAFQIMMFTTAGLTLAIPLIELSGVISWPEALTEMPGHTESYLGIVQHLEKKVPVIDIAQIVFPQDRLSSLIDSQPLDRLQRIVFINNFEWGLACDAVNEVITIEPDQIKWRKKAITRSWLAGTVVEHMCALLDTNELSKLLKSDHN